MKAALALSTLLATFTLACGNAQDQQVQASEGTSALLSAPRNGPITCSIQTINGRFLTAVGGGGRISDVLHTDATQALAWEKFVLEDLGEGDSSFGFRTKSGRYLTAVGGGGRITDVIHSDAVQINAWERLRLVSVAGGYYAIQTYNGRYLTATGGGGRTYDAIHSDAAAINAWEKFKFSCVAGG